MGLNAGHYIGEKLKDKQNAKVVELAGLDNLELTKQRSQGFDDALKNYPNIKKVARQAAEFTVESGQAKMAQLLQAQSRIDALWNHDDDQGVGALRAIEQAGRDEFLMVGGAGALAAFEAIKADSGVLKATVLYPPTMAASAIDLARALGQSKGIGGLAEFEIPSSVTCYSAVVDKENVDQYMPTGFSEEPRPTGLTSPPGEGRPARHDDEEDLRMAQPQASDGAETGKPPLRIGMVGYAFMGAAHSQGWRTAGRVFDLPLRPEMAVICGRDADAVRAAADRHGWAGTETDWRALVERDDVDLVDICTPATATPRSPSPRSPPASTCCAKNPRQHRGRGRGHGPRRRRGDRARPVGDGRLQLPPGPRDRAGPPDGGRGPDRHPAARAGRLSPGLAGGPGVPADLAAAPRAGRLRFPRRPRRAHRRPGPVSVRRTAGGRLRAHRDVRTGATAAHRAQQRSGRRLRGRHRTGHRRRRRPLHRAVRLRCPRLLRGHPVRHRTQERPAHRTQRRARLARLRPGAAQRARVPRRHRARHTRRVPPHPRHRTRAPLPRGLVAPGHGLGYEHTFVHQARDLVHAVADGRAPEPSFADGLQVQRVLAAVEESAEKNSVYTSIAA
ncbi:hypothetical protein SHKM778_35060 [Streptomyces sp. KM77-8]|uniref:Gfo/Idh/MocA-like oxidoreductase N-terminal domain-containing protein n=1 Tax=Streptomyces haneummycinicus TaxID=3074435 RepID=A0AAT9HHY6_9ACTN